MLLCWLAECCEASWFVPLRRLANKVKSTIAVPCRKVYSILKLREENTYRVALNGPGGRREERIWAPALPRLRGPLQVPQTKQDQDKQSLYLIFIVSSTCRLPPIIRSNEVHIVFTQLHSTKHLPKLKRGSRLKPWMTTNGALKSNSVQSKTKIKAIPVFVKAANFGILLDRRFTSSFIYR